MRKFNWPLIFSAVPIAIYLTAHTVVTLQGRFSSAEAALIYAFFLGLCGSGMGFFLTWKKRISHEVVILFFPTLSTKSHLGTYLAFFMTILGYVGSSIFFHWAIFGIGEIR